MEIDLVNQLKEVSPTQVVQVAKDKTKQVLTKAGEVITSDAAEGVVKSLPLGGLVRDAIKAYQEGNK